MTRPCCRSWRTRARAAAGLVAIALLAGTSVACLSLRGNSGPKNVVELARKLARERTNGSPRLDRLLAGPLRSQASTAEGRAALLAELRSIESMTPLELVSSQQHADGSGASTHVYTATASAHDPQGAVVRYRVTVRCAETIEHQHTDASKGVCRPDPSDPTLPEICDADTPSTDWDDVSEDCELTDLAPQAP